MQILKSSSKLLSGIFDRKEEEKEVEPKYHTFKSNETLTPLWTQFLQLEGDPGLLKTFLVTWKGARYNQIHYPSLFLPAHLPDIPPAIPPLPTLLYHHLASFHRLLESDPLPAHLSTFQHSPSFDTGLDYLILTSALSQSPSNALKFCDEKHITSKCYNLLYVSVHRLQELIGSDIGMDQMWADYWYYISFVVCHCLVVLIHSTRPFPLPSAFCALFGVDGGGSALSDFSYRMRTNLIPGLQAIFKDLCKMIQGQSMISLLEREAPLLTSMYVMTLLTITTIGFSFHGNKEFIETTKENIHFLVQCIGWPQNIESAPWIVHFETNQQETFILTAISTLIEVLQSDPTHSFRFRALGGCERIMDTIFWTVDTFSSSPLPNTSFARSVDEITIKQGTEPVSWKIQNKQLDTLFTIMYNFFILDSNSMEEVTEMRGHKRSSSNSSLTGNPHLQLQKKHFSFNQLLDTQRGVGPKNGVEAPWNEERKMVFNQTLIPLLIDLFNEDIRQTPNNIRVRDLIKNTIPELQLFILRLFVQLVKDSLLDVSLFHKLRIWEMLFSDFYMTPIKWAIRSKTRSNPTYPDTFPYQKLDGTTVLFDIPTKDYFCSQLETYTYDFLNFMCLNLGDISKEVELFVQTLKENLDERMDTKTSLHIAHILYFLSTSLPRTKVSTFLTPTFFELLSNTIMHIHRLIETQVPQEKKALHSLFEGELPYQPNNEEELNDIIHTREKLFGFMSTFLNTRLAAVGAIKSVPFIDMIHNLLYFPDSRDYALHHIIRLINTKDVDKFLVESVFNKYLNFMLSLKDLHQTNLLLLLLEKGLTSAVLNGKGKEQQNIFLDVNGFLKVIDLLNYEPKTTEERSRLMRICIGVLKCLTYLLMGNNKNKEHFCSTIGYEHFSTLVVDAFCKSLPEEVLGPLLNLLVDGEFEKEKDMLIQNKDVIVMIFKLAPYFEERVELEIYQIFESIFSKSIVNTVLACQSGLIGFLIQRVPQIVDREKDQLYTFVKLLENGDEFSINTTGTLMIINILKLLAKQSITVGELKKLLDLLRPIQMNVGEVIGYFTPLMFPVVIDALDVISTQLVTSGQDTLFNFDGKESEIIIHNIALFPPFDRSFTFCTWMRIESFESPTGSQEYRPRLLSFIDNSNSGIELFFSKNGSLSIGMELKEEKPEVETFKYIFECKRWYFLSFSLVNSLKIWGKSTEVKLFINGELIEKRILRKVARYENVTCRVGSGLQQPKTEMTDHHIPISPNTEGRSDLFFGLMGDIYMFEEDFTTPQIKEFYELEKDSRDYTSKKTKMSITLDMTKLFAYYTVKAVIGNVCYDYSPWKKIDSVLDAYVHNVKCLVRSDVKDLISCIGGAKIILPLFLQLNQPFPPLTPEITYSAYPGLSTLIFNLLSTLIKDNLTNQNEINRISGCSILTYLLLQTSPENLTIPFLRKIQELLDYPKFSSDLKTKLILHLLLDFDLWIYTSYKVQKSLLGMILNLYKADKNLKSFFGVQQFLDVMRVYYWRQCNSVSRAVAPLEHPITRKRIGERPPKKECTELRKQIRAIISDMTQPNGFSHGEFKIILAFIVSTSSTDPKLCLEMMDTLASILMYHKLYNLGNTKKSKSTIPLPVQSIFDHGGIDIFKRVICSSNENVRVQGLIIINHLIEILEKIPPNYLTFKPITWEDIIAQVYLLLKKNPFTSKIYVTLLRLMTGKLESRQMNIRSMTIDDQLVITKKSIFQYIFLLCSTSKDTKLKNNVLTDILLMLKNPTNQSIIVEMVGWPSWIYGIVDEVSNECMELVIDIFKNLTIYGLERMESFQKQIDEIFTYVRIKTATPNDSNGHTDSPPLFSETFLRFYLEGVLEAVRAETQERSFVLDTSGFTLLAKKRKFSPFLHNLVHLLVSIGEYIFYPFTGDFSMVWWYKNTATNTPWIYEKLVVSTLETIETFKLIEQVPGSGIILTDMRIRFATSCLYHISETTPVAHLSEMLRKLILPETENVEFTSLHQYALFNLVSAIKNNSMQILCKWGAPLIPLMKDLLLKFVAHAKAQYKAKAEQESARLVVLEDYERTLTEETKVTSVNEQYDDIKIYIAGFFSVVFLKEKWEVVHSILNWNVAAQLTDQCKMKESIMMNFIKSRSMIQKRMEEDAKRENEIEKNFAILFQQNLEETESERMISKTYFQQLRAKQARQFRHIQKIYNSIDEANLDNPHKKIHWKLDKTENHLRMHLKLKRNNHFDSHKDALKHRKQVLIEDDTNLLPVIHFARENHEISMGDENYLKFEAGNDNNNTARNINDGLFDEEISEKTKFKVLLSVDCDLITVERVTKGKLEISTLNVTFREKMREDEEENNQIRAGKKKYIIKSWLHKEIKEIALRRYLLRHSAIEFQCTDMKSYFLNFDRKDKNKVYSTIIQLNRNNLLYHSDPKPSQILRYGGMMEQWVQGQISNFEYLMYLNTISGRSYNDMTQYPVFPWVLLDYKSKTLDLSNPEIYRDLKKPIGALNEKRLKDCLDRYNNWPDSTSPFMYGSHYSTSHSVAFYLIRMEPFTTVSIGIQDGKFDHADRLFDSIGSCWENCLNASTDFKELIPEFFYLPEFLVNTNNFDFGTTQSGVKLGDVVLPPWADGKPEEFIRLHRAALESEYVSRNLHHWIDLIFGYKQEGVEAIKAFNVYHHLCYERNVDLDSVTPEEKQRIEATIAYFGQVPSQLLSYPHPERKAYLPKPVVTWETLDEENVVSLSASTYKKYKISELSQTTIIGIFVLPETTESLPGQSIQGNVGEDYRIITIDENSNFMINRYRTKEKYPFLRDTKEPGRLLLPPNTTSKIFAVSNDGKSLFAGGFWDNSIKVVEIDQRFDIASHQTIYQHKAPVTCLCLTENNHYLISGSEDTTLRIWDVIDGYRVAPTTPTNSYMLDPRGSKHVLYGHRERVLSVVASTDFDCCVSGSTGVIIIHKITNGDYIRTIKLKPEETVDLLAFQSAMGHFAVFSKSSLMIYLFSINGTLIVSKEASEQLSSLVFSRDGNLLFSGGLRGSLTIRQSHNLHTIQKISISSPIYALSIINEKSIMLGTPKTVVWIKVSKKGDKKNNYKTIKL